MRWLVKTPCLALGDKVLGKGDIIPEGALPQESIDAFLKKGYLALDSVAPKPEVKPLIKVRGVMADNLLEIPEMKEPEPTPEKKGAPVLEPEKLSGEVENDEPLPVVKRRKRKVSK